MLQGYNFLTLNYLFSHMFTSCSVEDNRPWFVENSRKKYRKQIDRSSKKFNISIVVLWNPFLIWMWLRFTISMDLVISHPVIKDKGIRNIYSGLHDHHLVGPRSCDTGQKQIKEDINHVHAMEKFRRSQLEYIPKFKTCLPKAPAYTVVNGNRIRKIVERLYSAGKRPQTTSVAGTEVSSSSGDHRNVRTVRFSGLKSASSTDSRTKQRAQSAAHPRALIIFPNMRSRRNCRSAKSATGSVISDEKPTRSESPTSCRSDLTLDLSKLNRRKKHRPRTSGKSEGYPSVLSSISNCYSEKDQSHYQPSRQSLFEMIQDLYLDEDTDWVVL